MQKKKKGNQLRDDIFHATRVETGSSELIIRTEQQGLFIVPPGAEVAVAPGQGRPPASLQCGLLGVLLIGWREVMDGVLDHVSWIHGLLQAA